MANQKFFSQIWILFFVSFFTLTLVSCGEQISINKAKNASGPEEVIERNLSYLNEYPQGEYAQEAISRLDNAAIILARRDKTITAFENYLEINPEGKYIDEAWLSLVALGQGVPGAQVFDPEKPGPYRLVIGELYRPSVAQVERYRIHKWQGMLPPSWVAESVSDAVLFVFIKESKIKSDSRRYDNGKEIFGYKIQTEIEIKEVKTGNILHSGLLIGSDPIFPAVVSSNQYPTIIGSVVNYATFEKWLLSTLK